MLGFLSSVKSDGCDSSDFSETEEQEQSGKKEKRDQSEEIEEKVRSEIKDIIEEIISSEELQRIKINFEFEEVVNGDKAIILMRATKAELKNSGFEKEFNDCNQYTISFLNSAGYESSCSNSWQHFFDTYESKLSASKKEEIEKWTQDQLKNKQFLNELNIIGKVSGRQILVDAEHFYKIIYLLSKGLKKKDYEVQKIIGEKFESKLELDKKSDMPQFTFRPIRVTNAEVASLIKVHLIKAEAPSRLLSGIELNRKEAEYLKDKLGNNSVMTLDLSAIIFTGKNIALISQALSEAKSIGLLKLNLNNSNALLVSKLLQAAAKNANISELELQFDREAEDDKKSFFIGMNEFKGSFAKITIVHKSTKMANLVLSSLLDNLTSENALECLKIDGEIDDKLLSLISAQLHQKGKLKNLKTLVFANCRESLNSKIAASFRQKLRKNRGGDLEKLSFENCSYLYEQDRKALEEELQIKKSLADGDFASLPDDFFAGEMLDLSNLPFFNGKTSEDLLAKVIEDLCSKLVNNSSIRHLDLSQNPSITRSVLQLLVGKLDANKTIVTLKIDSNLAKECPVLKEYLNRNRNIFKDNLLDQVLKKMNVTRKDFENLETKRSELRQMEEQLKVKQKEEAKQEKEVKQKLSRLTNEINMLKTDLNSLSKKDTTSFSEEAKKYHDSCIDDLNKFIDEKKTERDDLQKQLSSNENVSFFAHPSSKNDEYKLITQAKDQIATLQRKKLWFELVQTMPISVIESFNKDSQFIMPAKYFTQENFENIKELAIKLYLDNNKSSEVVIIERYKTIFLKILPNMYQALMDANDQNPGLGSRVFDNIIQSMLNFSKNADSLDRFEMSHLDDFLNTLVPEYLPMLADYDNCRFLAAVFSAIIYYLSEEKGQKEGEELFQDSYLFKYVLDRISLLKKKIMGEDISRKIKQLPREKSRSDKDIIAILKGLIEQAPSAMKAQENSKAKGGNSLKKKTCSIQ